MGDEVFFLRAPLRRSLTPAPLPKGEGRLESSLLPSGEGEGMRGWRPRRGEVEVNGIEQVLDFWFGACGADGALDPAKRKMWFGDGKKYDAEIRERFGALHQRACRGECAGWVWNSSASEASFDPRTESLCSTSTSPKGL